MIRGQIRVIRHTHKCIATFFACASFHVPTCSLSPAVGKVGKPRWGHPLVEFVIVGKITGLPKTPRPLVHACAFTHALKGRPREMRTVNLV